MSRTPLGIPKATPRSRLRTLAKRLGRGCATTVGRLLKPLGYSLTTNVKRLIGRTHPQRDQQSRLIQRLTGQFHRHGQPTISVDAKQSELSGRFTHAGSRYCRRADVVNTDDFPSDAECRATPYGVYDAQANQALVNVGTHAATAQLAVASVRRWWEQLSQARYPKARHLLIEADAGGCNGHRPRLWKRELQHLAHDTNLNITVCHDPSGGSKWNPIAHRLLSQIRRNWVGHPLHSLDIMLAFIRGTTTTKGLKVKAILDTTVYAKGIKVSTREMATLNSRRRQLCPNLNDTIRPSKSGSS